MGRWKENNTQKMAEQVDVKINIITTENPPLASIESATEGIADAASSASDSFEDLGNNAQAASGNIGKIKGVLGPIKGLISQLTGGISDGFFQAFQAIKAASLGLKGFKLALAATGIGAAIAALGFLAEALMKSRQAAKAAEETLKNLNDQFKVSNANIIQNAQGIQALSSAYEKGELNQSQYIAGLAELGITIDANNLKTKNSIDQINELAGLNGMLGNIQAQRAKQEALLAEAVKQGNSEQIRSLQEQITTLDVSIAKVAGRRKEILDFFEKQKQVDEKFKAEQTNIPAYFNAVQVEAETLLEVIFGSKADLDKKIEAFGENVSKGIQRQLPITKDAAEEQLASFSDYLNNLSRNTSAFFDGEQGKAISASLATAATFTKTLSDAQDVSSREAFESAKKYKIASVITSALQSSFEAYGSAQQFGPVLGPILGAAQVAAIAIASNKAIQDIKGSTFDSPSSPQLSTPPAPAGAQPQFNIVGQGGINQLAASVGRQNRQPIRAYVVGGDVTTSQELERRRIRTATFG